MTSSVLRPDAPPLADAVVSSSSAPSVMHAAQPRAIAVISVHASPLGRLGRGENGGMNHVIRRHCQGLAEHGVPTDVFVRRDDRDSPSEELIAPGSRLVRITAGPAAPLAKEHVLPHLPAFTAAVLEHAASERRRYRLVHAHYWLSGWAARRLAQRWQVALVQSFHTLAREKERVGAPREDERAAVEALLVRAADRLVTGSVAEERALVDLYDADPARICVVPPGVDLNQFAPRPTATLRRRLGLLDRRVVLYAGRLERLKGPDILLEAMATLSQRPDMGDVVVLVAGEDSGDGRAQSEHPHGERGRLEALTRGLGLSGRVHFLGARTPDELAELYALADVCVVPSRTETFGLVALEAQASGTPVVAAHVGGLVDIVDDGQTGFLVRDGHADEFAAAITRLLVDARLRERMGAAARLRATGLSWAHATDRLLGLYECVVAPVPAGALETCGCL